VTGLGLTNYNLSGTISPAIANLTGLRKLDLAGNRLTGEIPDALAALPNLVLVDVRNNRLTGKLPKFRASVDVSAEGNSPSLRSHHGSGQGSLDDGSSPSSDSAADASSKLSAGNCYSWHCRSCACFLDGQLACKSLVCLHKILF
jgi:hypothetical protein